ncbi:uncharacterized protein G2W53_045145 [Senna tora]|uniref:Uncharacterized protein n=1 Tax=Senna tora TaxID=362788 RepID=A0A834SCY0_9FABA|nr:uncharacterized protein G2W53_045145 [Senna tora]
MDPIKDGMEEGDVAADKEAEGDDGIESSLRHSLPSRQRQRLHPLAPDNHRHRYSYSPLLHLCSVLSALFPILGGELSPTKKPAVSSQHWKDLHSPEAG